LGGLTPDEVASLREGMQEEKERKKKRVE